MQTQPVTPGSVHPQVPLTPKTAGLAIASLVCGILAFCIPLLPGLIGIVLGIIAIRKINASNGALGGKGLAIGGLVSSGIATLITVIILPAMLLPALARAKAKANRIKCLNNLKSVYVGSANFAQDNRERLPWQLSASGVRMHFGDVSSDVTYGVSRTPELNELYAHPSTLQTAGVFGMPAMKRELATPKILHSPCDGSRASANEIVQNNWRSYDTRFGGVSEQLGLGVSYTYVRGADSQRPSSVLAVTRNWSDASLDKGNWLGADKDKGNNRVISGLDFSQGQVVLMDGSARQSSNADFGGGGKMTRSAEFARGGVAKGNTSLRILRGPGLD